MAELDAAAGASKRPKLDESVRVQLKSVEGAELGPALEVPLASGPAELGSIVQKLKNDTNSTPYAFYAGEVSVPGTLQEFQEQYTFSTEQTLPLTYEPLAVFRVRRVDERGRHDHGLSGATRSRRAGGVGRPGGRAERACCACTRREADECAGRQGLARRC